MTRETDKSQIIYKDAESGYGSTENYKKLDDEEAPKFGFLPQWFVSEFKEIFSLAWYLSVINLFSNIMGTLSVLFCGHLGTSELDGVSLAVSLLNVFGVCIANGLCTACDTLFSQSFGSTNKKKVGIYLQQSLCIIPLFVLPCWAIHLNVESFLILLGNTEEVAAIAGRYLVILMPGTFALFVLRIMTTYLRSQNVLWPTMVSGLIGTITNVLGHLIALYWFDFGIEGSAFVQAFSFIAMLSFTLFYILVSGMYRETWPGWTWEAFSDWGRFLYIGVAGMLMLFASVFGQEIGTILASTLGEIELGAQSILFNTQVIVFTIPFGFGIACNIRIGQLLGAKQPEKARSSAMIGLGIVIATTMVIGTLGTLLRQELPRLFTSNDSIIAMTAAAFPVVSFNFVFDGTTVCFLGILRGCNKESLATAITFLGYYIIGLPVAIIFIFVLSMGIEGFWWGLTIGMALNVILYMVVLYKVDYEQEVKRALARAGLSSDDIEAKPLRHTTMQREHKLHLESDDEDLNEKAALLTYKDVARHKTQKRLMKFQQTLYGNNPYHSRNQLYIPVMALKDNESNSTTFIFATRALFILFMLSLLVIGLLCRFLIVSTPDSVDPTVMTVAPNLHDIIT